MLSHLSVSEKEKLLKLALSLNLKKTHAVLPPIQPRDLHAPAPLSFAQQRLWFLAQMEGTSETYHISLGLRLSGDLDRIALRQALDQILQRHEALRTVFRFAQDDPIQLVLQDTAFSLTEHDLCGCRDSEEELARLAAEEASEPFDLQAGPLLRGRLIRLSDEEHVLLITMHHIVSDGWSMDIFRRELSTLYAAFRNGEPDPLPVLPIQYADYAVWQREWI
ncbi:condensation domain-containing protein, partial [Granulicella sp. L60]|uniref:condensation domain-containing protein n=1 Tax=Granulicella sp. L60 TaxID=1641866 RepID=UPI001C2099AE